MYKRMFQWFVQIVLAVLLALVLAVPAMAAGLGQDVGLPTWSELAIKAAVVAALMAMVANRLTAGLITPIWEKLNLDKFWLMYVAWAVGGGLVWITHVNIFVDFVPDPLTGQILTALVSGGGANILHDLIDKK